jgi:hypothetical protein
MLALLRFHEIAAKRGDGLRPEFLRLRCQQTVVAAAPGEIGQPVRQFDGACANQHDAGLSIKPSASPSLLQLQGTNKARSC